MQRRRGRSTVTLSKYIGSASISLVVLLHVVERVCVRVGVLRVVISRTEPLRSLCEMERRDSERASEQGGSFCVFCLRQ